MPGPKFAKDDQTYQVPLVTIVSVVKMMLTARANDTSQLDDLVKSVGDVAVPVPGTVVNEVKRALFRGEVHNVFPEARTMIGLEGAPTALSGDVDCPNGRCPHIQH